MALSAGDPRVVVGLLDGPVASSHPALSGTPVRHLGTADADSAHPAGFSCAHGTFVGGILSAGRGSGAPAICPGCTLLVRPIFRDSADAPASAAPSAPPHDVAAGLVECIEAGARLVNFSAALTQLPGAAGQRALQQALDLAAHRGVVVVAASGNEGRVGSTVVTRHPWVIPVSSCDDRGWPSGSTLGASIGRHGLRAPGVRVTSLAAAGGTTQSSGTSAAAPFVSGALALAWSLFPSLTGATVRRAVAIAHRPSRSRLVPPLLDASALYTVVHALATGGES